jgi:hypothetical protein
MAIAPAGYVGSALLIQSLPRPDSAVTAQTPRTSTAQPIEEGRQYVLRHEAIRARAPTASMLCLTVGGLLTLEGAADGSTSCRRRCRPGSTPAAEPVRSTRISTISPGHGKSLKTPVPRRPAASKHPREHEKNKRNEVPSEPGNAISSGCSGSEAPSLIVRCSPFPNARPSAELSAAPLVVLIFGGAG